ncbi:uncharacterized protein C8Q71DRAFT_234314 [Rhodofomes roseus]|uniref:Uncharacterized protein n=1 Tax=Rhodofomes roseus TaxID=34475 RepID=A0ABQ8KVH7_9APHY|nr:uncharacterized protein C8Q71DRAFT_234314 [Rhodofomes roseus]KAH9843082.1 hypothetical protein C8Q71DRAFT_234314 [Rhodofomes roseus]
MPLKIKIPKQSSQAPESSQSAKPSKRRVDSDLDDDYSREATEEPVRPRPKRSRTYESNGADEGAVQEGGDEADINVDVVGDEQVPRATKRDPSSSTSPPPTKTSRRSSKSTTSDRRGSTAGSSKPKRKTRQVVWTDDEDDDVDPLGLTAMDPDDDEFEPEPSVSKRSSGKTKAAKGGARSSRTKAKVEEKEIVIRDERKLPPPDPPAPKEKPSTSRIPLKRPPSSEDAEVPVESSAATGTSVPDDPALKAEDAEPPPPKKRKLPPIKKNKTSTGPSTPAPAKPPTAVSKVDSSTPAKDPNGPVGVAARKPAAAMGAADFDLRDASVYASLFNKPVKQMPDSGLNRRQREEDRRRYLNKLRDEARAKRTEEVKRAFDLQAPHDKIMRFEEKLRAHNSIALYPNVLGAFWKDPRR